MALLAGTVLTDTKALLNDPSGSIYPDVALLPILRKSYTELQTRLSGMGYSFNKEASIPIVVNIGTVLLADGAGLPSDLLLPIELWERPAGSSERFTEMREEMWEPTERPSDTLRYWVWREESIRLLGATTAREVLIKYKKSLVVIADVNTPILINNSQIWLAQRTAALASLLIGSNQTRADRLMEDLNSQQGPWEDLKANLMHRMQSIPVRRRRTRWRKR